MPPVRSRFVPPRLAFEESQRVFQQAEEPSPSTVRTHKIIPHESDAARGRSTPLCLFTIPLWISEWYRWG